MPTNFPKPSRTRFLKAYWLTVRILSRYLGLYLLGKIFSDERLANRRKMAHRKTAIQLKSNIMSLQGLFIKVGQMVSIMTHFLPEVITKELEGLQDAVPPAPYSAIQQRFREEFGKQPGQVFAQFEAKPLASASLGQVHRAQTRDGDMVAVKVQYPYIEAIVHSDLKTIKRIYGLLNLLFPQYGLKKAYQEIKEVVLDELDFQKEGKNLETLQENLVDEPDLLFPKVYWDLSTQRILTLEFMEGVKISRVDKLQEMGLNPTEVAEKIIHAYCQQIFIDGIYHADPHPGNFLVQAVEEEVLSANLTSEDRDALEENEASETLKKEKRIVPKIVMMDFGAVARISEPMRQGMGRFVEGIIRQDRQLISDAVKSMGFIAKDQDEEVFDKIVEFFYERLKDVKIEELKNLKLNGDKRIEDFLEFRKLDIPFKELLHSFNVPKDWALLERTLILLMGLTTHLDPKFDPLTIILPYAEEFVLGKDRSFADLILDTAKQVALSYLKLPTELERTLRRLNEGKIELTGKNAKRESMRMTRAINRLTYSLLSLGGLGFGYALQKQGVPEYLWSYYASGFFGALLGVNLLKRD